MSYHVLVFVLQTPYFIVCCVYNDDKRLEPTLTYMSACVPLGENLAFWEAAEELKYGTASSMSTKAETIFK